MLKVATSGDVLPNRTPRHPVVAKTTRTEKEPLLVILDLLHVILHLIPHRVLLVRQPLELALHNPKLVLQHPSPLDNICRAGRKNLFIQKVFLLFLLLRVLHLGVLIAVWSFTGAIAGFLLLSLFTFEIVEIF